MRRKKRKKKEAADITFLSYGIVCAAALVLIYNQLFSWMFFSWLYNPYINYGIVIPFVCAYLAYNRRDALKRRRNDYGLVVVAVAFVLFFFSSMYVRAASLLLMVIGLTAFFFGFQTVRKFWFELLYPVFMVPLPEHIIESVGLFLKQTSINAAIWLSSPFAQVSLDLDYIVVNGSYLLRYGMECSGLESFLAFTVFSVLFVHLFERKWWRGSLVVILSPLASMMLNVLRLTLLVAMAPVQGDLVMFLFHLTAGPTMVLIYGLILMMVYRGEIWKKR